MAYEHELVAFVCHPSDVFASRNVVSCGDKELPVVTLDSCPRNMGYFVDQASLDEMKDRDAEIVSEADEL